MSKPGEVQVADGDLRLTTDALDWLTSVRDEETVLVSTGWPAVGMAWLSQSLEPRAGQGAHAPPDPAEAGAVALCDAVAGDIARGLEARGFAAATVVARGGTTELWFGRDPGPGVEARVAVAVSVWEGPAVLIGVRVGVRDAGVEGALADVLGPGAGVPDTAETFLLDLLPGDAAPVWSRVALGEQDAAVAALMDDVDAYAVPWWAGRDTRAGLLDGLAADTGRGLVGDRRLAAGRALDGDRAGAAEALGRHLALLPSWPWPVRAYLTGFLTRFADRFTLDLGGFASDSSLPPDGSPGGLPDGTSMPRARTPLTLVPEDGGPVRTFDAARAAAVIAALGLVLAEDDIEYETAVGAPRAQARALRGRLLAAVGRPSDVRG